MNDMADTLPRAENAGSGASLLPDPLDVIRIIRRRLPVFLTVFVVICALVATYALTRRKIYESTASVLIEPRKSDVIDFNAVVSGLPPDTNVVDTQVQLIASPTVALRVIRALHLDQDSEFAAKQSEPTLVAGSGVAGSGGDKIKLTEGERTAITNLARAVSVYRSGLTYVINITAASLRPEMSARIANEYAHQYLTLQRSQTVERTEQAAQWTQKRADELRAEAVSDDAALQHYMIANNLLSSDGKTMAEQEVSRLNQQIADAQAQLAEQQGKLSAARGQVAQGGGGADIGAALSSETVRALRQQEATASANLANLTARYGDQYPDVIKARDELRDVQRQLAGELGRIRSTLAANVRIAQTRLSSLESSQSRATGSLSANGNAQIGLMQLQRKADASRAVYNAFLARAKETSAQVTIPQSDASIATAAHTPDLPTSPNLKLLALAGIALGIVGGLISILIAEYLDRGIGTKEDVERKLGVRYAGSIPELRSTLGRRRNDAPPHVYILDHPMSAFAEALRGLASFIRLRDPEKAKVIVFTSALPREGKSTVAVCLGRSLALSGARVVLVDFDVRRRTASNLLVGPLEGEHLFEVLKGTRSLDDALVKDSATDLVILPTRGPASPNDVIESDDVERLFARLRAHFDVVIVDTAPTLALVETRTIAAHADAVLLIAAWRKSSVKAAEAALDLLQQAGAPVVGAALSRVDIRKFAATGQADAFGYHNKFTGYYLN